MKIRKYKNTILILVSAIALAVFGCVMVYSASKYAAYQQYGNEFFYLKKQVMGVAIGIVGLFACSFINHKIYKKFYWIFYFIGLVFLILVFIPGYTLQIFASKELHGYIQANSYNVKNICAAEEAKKRSKAKERFFRWK